MSKNLSPEPNCLEDLEEQLRNKYVSCGYDTGLQMGRKSGQDEGYAHGLAEGAKIGSEIGYYKGCTMTWIQLLQLNPAESTKSSKMLKKLQEIIELVDSYPKTNEACEEKLSKIRVKFKQSTSLLNLKV